MNNKRKGKRLVSFDVLKFFAMFLVLWGHCIQQFIPDYGMCENKTIFTFIYSVHMPLFACTSGFFAFHSLEKAYADGIVRGGYQLLRNKFLQLILPCLTMGIPLVLIEYLLSVHSPLSFPMESFTDVARRYITCLWFLKALFFIYVFSFVLKAIYRKSIAVCSVVMLLSLFLFTSFSLWFLIPSFLVGIYIRKNFESIIKKRNLLTIVTGVLFLLLLLYWNKPFYKGLFLTELFREDNLAVLILEIYRIAVAAIGSFFFILLFSYIKRNDIVTKLLGNVGQNTLGIYIIQSIVLERLLPLYIHIPMNNIYNQLCMFPLALIMMFVCDWIVILICKSPVLGFTLLGKQRSI